MGRRAHTPANCKLISHLPHHLCLIERLRPERFFSSHTISLAHGKQQVLDVLAETKRHFCRDEVILDVLDGSHRSTMIVNNRGTGFAVSAQAPGRTKAPFAGYQTYTWVE